VANVVIRVEYYENEMKMNIIESLNWRHATKPMNAAAALEEVDATPMEGFNNALLDEILNLKSQGLTSTLLMPIGYRDLKNDYLAGAPKIRKSNDELFEMI
jgi:hypothetical protein